MEYKIIRKKKTLKINSRAEWRSWLSDNQDNADSIWLVYYKAHTKIPTLTKAEANKEALCFGWIDSLVMGIDDERYMQKFTPRKPDSIWSELNKKRVAELESQGLIQAAGRALIDHAKASGEWDKDRGTPEVVDAPDFFEDLLQANKKAREFWDELTPGQRKQFLLWITLAKREETRLRRAEKTINMLTNQQLPSML